jgi:hypothetical protein
MEMRGQLHAPAILIRKEPRRCSPNRRLGGPQSRVGRSAEVKKLLTLPRLKPRIIQPVVSRYTNCAIPGPWFHTALSSRISFT